MPSRSKPVIGLGYRPDLVNPDMSCWLDHFRWLSALMVAASHLRNMIMPDAGQLGPFAAVFYFFTLFAEQAVVVFFVLSGLLVGGTIVRGVRAGSFVPGKYAVDRASRLYVALIPALLLSVALQWTLGAVSCPVPDTVLRVTGNLLFVQNFGGTPPCNNASLWSLSSEGYFYLVGPLLILAAVTRKPVAIVVALVALVPAAFVLSASRVTPLFGLGLWLCGLVPWFFHVRLPVWIAGLPLVSTLLASRMHWFPDSMVEVAIIALAFAFLLASDLGKIRAPAGRLAVGLASFSYSLYLVQMPIAQVFGRVWGYQTQPSDRLGSYARYAFALSVIVAVGWVFGRLFEAQTGKVRRRGMRLLGLDSVKS
ncbi:MAG: acyltransferase [Novosphingobium sp.]